MSCYDAVITSSISLLEVKVSECKQNSAGNTIRQLSEMLERKESSAAVSARSSAFQH